jgi:stress response protein YsnF
MTDPNPAEPEPAGPEMILSQDELVVNTELVESGRARLVKRVQVETVTRTIELRREVLEIEYLEPAHNGEAREVDLSPGDGAAGVSEVLESGLLAPGSWQEGVREIVLMQEEALITTQLVPRERVRLTKRVVTEDHAIEAELRGERADVEQRSAEPRQDPIA